jgi:hypothetical protein
VISDYKMPGWSGLAALRLVKERDVDVPFILASHVVARHCGAPGADVSRPSGERERLQSRNPDWGAG